MKKQSSLPELVAKAEEHMKALRYSKYTMGVYRSVWNALLKYAKEHNEQFMSAELGVSAMQSHYDVDIYSENLGKYQSHLRRAVNALLEFQITGCITKRKNRYNYRFPDGFASLGERFIEHLQKVLGLKSETIRNNFLNLEKFFNFCRFQGIEKISQVDVQLINDFSKTLVGYSKDYAAGQIRILRRFFDFAHESGETEAVFQWPKIMVYKDKDIPSYYKPEEIKAILEAVDRANPLGKRDYAILLLAARYGFRGGDIKLLEFSNIDWTRNEISITQQKTGKPLSLYLLPEVGWALIDYIKNGRPQSDCPKIFIRHMTPYDGFAYGGSFVQILRKYTDAANVKSKPEEKKTFHMLRYSLASNLLRQDIPLTTISGILGHSELDITAKYTRLDFNQLQVCALEVPDYDK